MRILTPLYVFLTNKARSAFYRDNMDECDYYLRKRLLLIPPHSSMNSVKECADSLAYTLQNIDAWEKAKRDKFTPETTEQAMENFNYWMEDFNKRQIANTAARLAIFSDAKTMIEVGCHAGALLILIDNYIKQAAMGSLAFTGIEPDLRPFELCRGHIERGTFHHGDHSILEDIDGKFDILLLSFVCLLCTAEELKQILIFASRSVQYIVIADDLSNTLSRPVFRRHYILHNFRDALKVNGFFVIDRIFLDNANEGATGILVASNVFNIQANNIRSTDSVF